MPIAPDLPPDVAYLADYTATVLLHGTLSAPFYRALLASAGRIAMVNDRRAVRHDESVSGAVLPYMYAGAMPAVMADPTPTEVAGYIEPKFYGWARAENAMTRMVSPEATNPRHRISMIQRRARQLGLAIGATERYNLVNGTGTGPNPSGIFTLFEAVAPASQTGTIGGLDKATYSFMRNAYVELTAKASDQLPGRPWPHIFDKVNELIELATVNETRPSHMVIPRATWNIMNDWLLVNYANSSNSTWGEAKDWMIQTMAFRWKGVVFYSDDTFPTNKGFLYFGTPNQDTRVNAGMGPSWDSLAEDADTGVIAPWESVNNDYLRLHLVSHTAFSSGYEFPAIRTGFDEVTPTIKSLSLEAHCGRAGSILGAPGTWLTE